MPAAEIGTHNAAGHPWLQSPAANHSLPRVNAHELPGLQRQLLGLDVTHTALLDGS